MMTTRSAVLMAMGLLASLVVFPARGEDGADGRDEALLGRLRGLVAARDYAGALEAADAALTTGNGGAVAWRYRAYALHQLGRHAEAEVAYRRTIELDPADGWAVTNLGGLLATMGRWVEAVNTVERAVRIAPSDREACARLSRLHRDRGNHAEALGAVRRGLAAGVEPVWAHAELGYLSWVLGDLEAGRSHWTRAKELGADPAACDHGLRLVEWDERSTGSPSAREDVRRRRLGDGAPWSFTVGNVEVETRVGPRLPREVENMLLALQREDRKFFGLKGEWVFRVRVFLARTLEEHEARRRTEFPGGYPGKAFHVDRRIPISVRGPQWRAPAVPGRGALDIHAAWSEVGLETSLSHELVHSVIRLRIPRAPDVPAWIDEGLATYHERIRDDRGRFRSGTERSDLVDVLRAGCADGSIASWSEMLTMPRAAFSGPRARLRYAQAWSMVHFLLEDRTRGGRTRILEYLDAVGEGRGRDDLDFRRLYGHDLEVIHAAWSEHVAALVEE